VTLVIPTNSLTEAFLFPPFGREVRMIWENDEQANANDMKIASSFLIQKSFSDSQAKKKKE
jgi:hypothetical protein